MQTSDCKYLLAYVGPFLAFVGIELGGYWSFSALIFAFLLVPVGDLVFPNNHISKDIEWEENRGTHPFFDWLLYLNLPIVYGLIVFLLYRITKTTLTMVEMVGMIIGVGIFIGAAGINVAHELGHRKNKFEQWMSKLLLLPALYQHFFIEHNRGHHRYVATYEDPATARYGESLYGFWIRSTLGSLRSAWRLEVSRLHKSGQPVYSAHNQMFQFVVMQTIYIITVLYFFGWTGVLVALIIAVIGFLLLESINYIEHYGLTRSRDQRGQYEKVAMKHSWNSDNILGRIFLYELTRHADHHYKASKKYQLLLHIEESPQLPTGYPGSIVLAMIPPLWFKIMNKRVPKLRSEVDGYMN